MSTDTVAREEGVVQVGPFTISYDLTGGRLGITVAVIEDGRMYVALADSFTREQITQRTVLR